MAREKFAHPDRVQIKTSRIHVDENCEGDLEDLSLIKRHFDIVEGRRGLRKSLDSLFGGVLGTRAVDYAYSHRTSCLPYIF